MEQIRKGNKGTEKIKIQELIDLMGLDVKQVYDEMAEYTKIMRNKGTPLKALHCLSRKSVDFFAILGINNMIEHLLELKDFN